MPGSLSPDRTPVTPAERAASNGHLGGILWLTGLSGAGKSTLGAGLERRLFAHRYHAILLDGDLLRDRINSDLGYGPAARAENIRRAGEIAALFAQAGMIAIAAFISPYRAGRDAIRSANAAWFNEIYVNAPLAVCEARDPKGLYRRARAGLIAEFTGISAPYEPPRAPELEIRSDRLSVDACIERLFAFAQSRFALPR